MIAIPSLSLKACAYLQNCWEIRSINLTLCWGC